MGSRWLPALVCALLFTLSGRAQDQAPDPDFVEKKASQESRAYLKRASFVESAGYADYDLTFQRLQWTVDPAAHFIEGAITSCFQPKIEGFSEISFDLVDSMQVDSVAYHGANISFVHSENKVNIQFPAAIAVGITDSLTVWYHGVPPSSGFGSFETSIQSGNPVMWTLSEPYGAMEWWPCKQSLVDKIDSIEVWVACPEGNKVASNGKLVSEITSEGKTTVVWKHNYPIVTYLVAIAVTNYEAFSDFLELEGGRKVEILNYVYPSYLDTAKTKSADVLDVMALFNELVGEYPFADEKYGHAQFGWGGGMEHQTMSFMYHLNFGLVAHEMAHQWFGDCITLGSWQDIWLNEGFATYLTGLCYENLLDGQYWDTWKTQEVTRITSALGGSVFVDDTTSVPRIFDGRLSYSKGSYLLHMLRWELGDGAFFNGLKNYFNDPQVKYGFASHEDFVNHMEAAGDTSLTGFFNDWYYGEGYPVYHISHYTDYGDNGKYKVDISQTSSDASVDFFEMHVPLRAWKDNESTDLRLHQTTNPQIFVLAERPDSIQFDPDLWLASRNSVVTKTVVLPNREMRIFPNPVVNELTIELNQGEKIVSLVIIDINGKVAKQLENLQTNKIGLGDLPGGVYLLRIKTDKSTYTESFIKTGQR
jgi:aminopeptidase N